MNKYLEIFLTALKLGITSFGGPVAHLGFFRNEYVERKQWLSDKVYQDLVSLCQFLPGPASSQVGIGVGIMRGGLLGAVLSFLGFTLPSVLMLIVAVYFFKVTDIDTDFIHGLMLVAVAVVLHALIGMSKNSLKHWTAMLIAVGSLLLNLLWVNPFVQIIVILLSGLIGIMIYKDGGKQADDMVVPVRKSTANIALLLLFGLLILLPLLAWILESEWIDMIDKLYRAGMLVFGGGHVVLPLLQSQFVPGMMEADQFISGYGLAQAVPGPLFTFGSYIGAVLFGVTGGIVAMIAIFLPAFLLVIGTLPYWQILRQNDLIARALKGINAGVIGILGAAWITPIITHTIKGVPDIIFAALLFVLMQYLKAPTWVIVLLGLLIGFVYYR